MGTSLQGRKIVVTRAEAQNESFVKSIKQEGGEALILPTIKLVEVADQTQIKKAFDQLDQIDWLVFTSTNAVRFFFRYAQEQQVKFYFYPNLKIATLGESTKLCLEQLGYRTNFVPIQYTAEVLAANMDENISGKTVLIPRSSLAKNTYLDVFESRGAKAIALEVYDNQQIVHKPETLKEILDQKPDSLTFTSGSTLRSFAENMRQAKLPFPDAKVFCIGPSTAEVARELEINVDGIAEPHTEQGLLEALK